MTPSALPFGRLWYGEPNGITNAIGYAKFYSRSHDAVIRVYDEAGQRDRNARARRRVQRTMKYVEFHLASVCWLCSSSQSADLNLWPPIKQFISTNPEIVAIAGLMLAISGIILTVLFYRLSRPRKLLAYATRTFRVVPDKRIKLKSLGIRYNGHTVERLSVTRLAVWNAGNGIHPAKRSRDEGSSSNIRRGRDHYV